MNLYTKRTLPNGIRLISAPLVESQTATIIVMFGTGSRYETPQTNGMAHFLEHMFFKGTEKRPNAVDITKTLDGVGAEFNAFTSKDHTAYYVKVAHEHLTLAVDVVSDILLHSRFDEKELEKEKGVIVEEINMYEDNPMMHVHDIFEEQMYQGNSLGWHIAGSRETVRATTRKDMVAYKETHYRGDNTVIAIAGRVGPETEAHIEKAFSKLPSRPASEGRPAGDGQNHDAAKKPKFEFPIFTVDQKAPRVKVLHRAAEQAQVMLGFPAYSYFDEDEMVAQVLATILGGNMSSRLFVSVREDRALAYMVRAGTTQYQDTGNFTIQSGLDKNRLQDALKVIRQELEKAADKGVTEEELARAKAYIEGKVSINLEDTSSLAQWYSEQELLTNETHTPEDRFKRLHKISAADVDRVAKNLFDFNKATLAIIGPYKDEKEFEGLLK